MKLIHNKLLSNFAFNCKLRHNTKGGGEVPVMVSIERVDLTRAEAQLHIHARPFTCPLFSST